MLLVAVASCAGCTWNSTFPILNKQSHLIQRQYVQYYNDCSYQHRKMLWGERNKIMVFTCKPVNQQE